MSKPFLYFDHAATTPLHPLVWEAMQPYFLEHWGNSSSQNPWGWPAANAVELARHQIATALNTDAHTITFTSGATESNNWVLKNLAPELIKSGKTHLLIGNLEHASVREPALWLNAHYPELQIEFLNTDSTGIVDLLDFKSKLRQETGLVSLMWVQNELGGINPIAEISQLCKNQSCWFHCDATQAVGKVSIDLSALPIHFLSASGHKLYGPKGIGFLYQNKQTPLLTPLLHGGGHEKGQRSGTIATPLIVGLGVAVQWVTQNQTTLNSHYEVLRNELVRQLSHEFSDLHIHTPLDKSVSSHLNFGFTKHQIPTVFHHIAVSRGSACLGQKGFTSFILNQLEVDSQLIKNSLRISLGKDNSLEDIGLLVAQLKKLAVPMAEVVRPYFLTSNP